jgi:hypothetical protein
MATHSYNLRSSGDCAITTSLPSYEELKRTVEKLQSLSKPPSKDMATLHAWVAAKTALGITKEEACAFFKKGCCMSKMMNKQNKLFSRNKKVEYHRFVWMGLVGYTALPYIYAMIDYPNFINAVLFNFSD